MGFVQQPRLLAAISIDTDRACDAAPLERSRACRRLGRRQRRGLRVRSDATARSARAPTIPIVGERQYACWLRARFEQSEQASCGRRPRTRSGQLFLGTGWVDHAFTGHAKGGRPLGPRPVDRPPASIHFLRLMRAVGPRHPRPLGSVRLHGWLEAHERAVPGASREPVPPRSRFRWRRLPAQGC